MYLLSFTVHYFVQVSARDEAVAEDATLYLLTLTIKRVLKNI